MNQLVKKSSLILIALVTLLSFSAPAQARQGWSVGAQILGNLFVTDGQPDLDPGIGLGLQVEYRFNQRWGLEGNFFLSWHDGDDAFEADSAVFLGLPTAELKFYLKGQESAWEPYLLAGLGLYFITEGNVDNDRSGVGLGGNFGVGVDYYPMDRLSIGVAAKFRPVAFIQGSGQSAGLINLGLIGNVAWHF